MDIFSFTMKLNFYVLQFHNKIIPINSLILTAHRLLLKWSSLHYEGCYRPLPWRNIQGKFIADISKLSICSGILQRGVATQNVYCTYVHCLDPGPVPYGFILIWHFLIQIGNVDLDRGAMKLTIIRIRICIGLAHWIRIRIKHRIDKEFLTKTRKMMGDVYPGARCFLSFIQNSKKQWYGYRIMDPVPIHLRFATHR